MLRSGADVQPFRRDWYWLSGRSVAHPSYGFGRLVPVMVVRLQLNPDMLAKTPAIGAEDVVRSVENRGDR